MSFTVFYKKNGVEKPIKLSFLDALRGVPDLKPQKPKSCSCCGKNHGKQSHPTQKKDKKKEESSKKGDDDLTEDDRIMMRLKEEKPGRPWSDILKATSFKDKSTAVARWKEIEHKAQDDTSETKSKKQEPKNKHDKHYNAEQEAKHAKNREEGLRKKEEAKKKAKAEKKNESWTTEDKSDDKVKSSKSGDSSGKPKNSASGINDMKAFADGYDRKKWLLAASKHYDKTGERITAAQAKAMAEGK